jgi:hypothetical protein
MIYSEVVLAADEYRRRLEDREYRVAHHQKLHIRLGNIRLVLALVAAGMAWESIWRHAFSPLWLAIPIAVFVAVAAYHSGILRARDLTMSAYRKEGPCCW